MKSKSGMKSIKDNKIILNDKEYTYVIQRKKIKNIYFRVKEDFKIYVSTNYLVSESQIEKLLKANTNEIEKLYQRMARKQENLIYLGDKLIFQYDNTKPRIENNIIYGKSEEECQKYIYSLSGDIFNQRMTRIKYQFNDLPDFKLRVRKMKTRWGVCNKKSMTITLNLELITKPVNLIDYVIIHELCHFKHMDHSPKFWSYVEKFYPYYKKARKELKY